MTIRISIADDDRSVADGIASEIAHLSDIEVVSISYNGIDVLSAARESLPDQILMDVKMPGMTGIEATRILRKEAPNIRVVVLTNTDTEETLFDALSAGARGYLLKTETVTSIAQAIRDIQNGGAALSPSVALKVMQFFHQHDIQPAAPDIFSHLSKRELEVLEYIAAGKTNEQIRHELGIEMVTVKKHVGNVLSKLHVNGRLEAAIIAQKNGFSTTQPPKRPFFFAPKSRQ